MSDELPDDVRAFVEPERAITELPPETSLRMLERLRMAVDAGGPGGDGGGPSGASPLAGATDGGAPSGGGATAGTPARSIWQTAGPLALGVVLGASLGIGGTLAWQSARVDRSPPAMAPSVAESTERPPEPDPADRAEIAEPARTFPPDERERDAGPPRRLEPSARPARPRAETAPTEPRPPDTLAEERRLLDAARSTITRGHPEEGLQVLARYAERYPDGSLREESEALRIRALIEQRALDEASAALERFAVRHPESLFTGGLRARLERARQR